MRWTAIVLGVALLGIGVTGLARAEEQSSWEFEVVPYAWVPGNFGTVNVKGHTADIDVTVRDGLDLGPAAMRCSPPATSPCATIA